MSTPTPAADAREALKPCPFCSAKAPEMNPLPLPGLYALQDQSPYYVVCEGCGGTGPTHDAQGEAADAWNFRAAGWTPPQPEAGGALTDRIAENLRRWGNDTAAGDWPVETADQLRLDLAAEHSGDCRKQPWTCMKCAAEATFKQAAEIAALAAQPDTAQAEGVGPHGAGLAAKVFADVPAPAETTGGWRPIAEAPKSTKVLVCYRNFLDNWRIVLATFYPTGTLEAAETLDDAFVDENGYAPEGWYEETETHDDLLPCDATPTHFMPLPPPPENDRRRG